MYPSKSASKAHILSGIYKFTLPRLYFTLFLFFAFLIARCYLPTLLLHPQLSLKSNAEFWDRLLSALHASVISTIAFLYLMQRIKEDTFITGCCFSIAYLAADGLFCPEQNKAIFVAHHLLLVFILLIAPSDRFRWVAQGLLGELIFLPLAYCWYLLHTNQEKSPQLLYASLFLLLLYFASRIANFTYLCYRLYKSKAKLELCMFAPIAGMSYYWFHLLCQKAAQLFHS